MDNTNIPSKSWKTVNEERKLLKKQRKQEKLLKALKEQEDLKKAKENEQKGKLTLSPSTISIAVPGSILENAQSIELRTYLAGQIARAACIFRINEVVVYDDVGLASVRETKFYSPNEVIAGNKKSDNLSENISKEESNNDVHTVRSSCLQLARILQYLECPQYLRKFFFPLHNDLKYSGLLNPLDAPHHLRKHNSFRYREGVVIEKPAKNNQCYVNAGLYNDVLVNKFLKPGLRVTVKLNDNEANLKKPRGTVVSPEEPYRETGVYWGYAVRIAHSLLEVFTKSPYVGGYDLTIGTSDRGKNIQEQSSQGFAYNHLLIVFGGLHGLENALSNDEKLDVNDPNLLFDHYINILPKQGSRTIRTEEALLIALATIQDKLKPHTPEIEETLRPEALARSEDTVYNKTKSSIVTSWKTKKKRKLVENNKNFESSKSDENNELNVSKRNIANFEIVSTNETQIRNNNSEKQNSDTNDLSKFD